MSHILGDGSFAGLVSALGNKMTVEGFKLVLKQLGLDVSITTHTMLIIIMIIYLFWYGYTGYVIKKFNIYEIFSIGYFKDLFFR